MTIAFYNREAVLRDRLNTFLTRDLKLPIADYYGNLSIEAILSLKAVLADINNIFTLRVCLDFVDWLTSSFNLCEADATRIRESVLTTKPGANGFDIYVPSPIRAIAEVKCNVPINQGSKYGSAQRDGIEKDVNALLQGKSKARVNHADCLKFLVLLDRPSIRAATDQLLRTSKVCRDKLIVAPHGTVPDRLDVVYLTYVGLTTAR